MSVKMGEILTNDAPQAAKLIPVIAPTPLAASESVITPVNSSVLSATDEAVKHLFGVVLLR